MVKIVECVPNFSCGRDPEILKKIIAEIEAVRGIFLLDQESDAAHNRSVVTFAGRPEVVIEAAFQATKKAAELINLDEHKGEHPRMGATDVIPLVPISEVSVNECIIWAEKLAQRIGKELKIPVYLYEKTARRSERRNLANVRKGEYETIKKEIGVDRKRDPDFGPKILGTAGATAVGVRDPLIAYNVNLDTRDVEIAKEIAKLVRESSGGFEAVKALGFSLEDRGIVQVSMNLTNYAITNVDRVFNFIKKEAKKRGVKVIESEVVGLIPEAALTAAAIHQLKLKNFKLDQILEVKLRQKMTQQDETLNQFIDKVASSLPTPGGGSVAAFSGSLGAALLLMVSGLTLKNKKYFEVHAEIRKIEQELRPILDKLRILVEMDSQVYQKVVRAYALPKNDESERLTRIKAIFKALRDATEVPLETAEICTDLLEFCYELARIGSRLAVSDVGVAVLMIQAAVKGALFNVKINLKELKKFDDSEWTVRARLKMKRMEQQLDNLTKKILDFVDEAL